MSSPPTSSPPIERRVFLQSLLASSVLAATQVRAEEAVAMPRRGIHTAAGRDRTGQPMRLGGAIPTDTKISTTDSGGGLYLFEHRHMTHGGPPRHYHHAQDEFFYVIEGGFDFEVGDERFRLGPGDTIFLPRRVPHVWAHRGEAPGTILGAVTPAGTFEQFFRELAGLPAPPPPDAAARLFAAHGMTVVGPPLHA